MNSIAVVLVQMQSRVGDVAANMATMKRIMREAASHDAQVVCFPETSLTGYSAERAAELAMPASCAEVDELFNVADSIGIAVCFGMFERSEDGNVYIAQPLHAGEMTLWHRKTHLGQKEQQAVSPGQTVETADVFGVRFGVQICWETHFPELSAIQRAQGSEVVLMPFASGASGEKRRTTWLKYLPARASDNGMFVLACNALLDSATTKSPTALGGGMMAFDSQGETIAECFELGERMLICELAGSLPREIDSSSVGRQSFFDCRRPDLFARYSPTVCT